MANPYTTTFRPYIGDDTETYASYNTQAYNPVTFSNPYQPPSSSSQAYAPPSRSYNDNSYNPFRNERDPRNSDEGRSSYGIVRRDLPIGGGNVDLTSGDGFSFRDLPGAIGGLFGTPGAVIGSLASEAIRPGGFGSVNTTNIPGFGPVAADMGPLAAFRAAIPGAGLADATLGAAARQTIQDVINSGIGLASSYGPGALGVYDPRTGTVSSFGLNQAQAANFNKYAPTAYREKQRQLSAQGIDQTPGFGSSAGNTAIGGDIRFSDIRNFNAGQPQRVGGGRLFGGLSPDERGRISNVNAGVIQRPYEGERIGAVPVPRVDVQSLAPISQGGRSDRAARAAAADRASASRDRTAEARERGRDSGGSRSGGSRGNRRDE